MQKMYRARAATIGEVLPQSRESAVTEAADELFTARTVVQEPSFPEIQTRAPPNRQCTPASPSATRFEDAISPI
jgi:hypothetical protein